MLNNFQTPSIFLGLFLRKLDVQDYQNFGESLPWRLPELDAEVQFNRVPPNTPPDVARVRFASKDTRLQLEVGPAKIHFRMMPGEVTKTEGGANVQAMPVPPAFDAFIPQAMRIHTTLAEHFGATAMRVGVVTEMIAPVPSSANQRMQTHYLSSKNLFGDRLQDLQIQALARVNISSDITVNRRISVRPMRTGAGANADLLLGVSVDINTLAEEPYDLSTQDLENFLRGVCDHLDHHVAMLNERAFFE